MSNQSEIDYYWNIYSAIKDWIIFSDAKAGAILAFYGVLGGILLPKIIDKQEYFCSNPFLIVPLIVGFIYPISSIRSAFLCLLPNEKAGESSSLIFYRHIDKKYSNPEDYLKDVEKIFLNDMGAKDQIAKQIWSLSKVASQKFTYVTKAIRSLIIAMIIVIIEIIGVLIWGCLQ